MKQKDYKRVLKEDQNYSKVQRPGTHNTYIDAFNGELAGGSCKGYEGACTYTEDRAKQGATGPRAAHQATEG
jgi:hypothetical protein